jgi:AcrR family transcriptional regulator
MARQARRRSTSVAGAVCAFPAVQSRSQQTRDRLLDAAESLLKKGGPDAATVPAIAEAAGVAVGSVYRRFPDKDAVLRGVYERFFSRSLEGNLAALAEEHWRSVPLREMIRTLIRAMVRGYELEAPLLAALLDYAEHHSDEAFRRHAEALRRSTFAAVERLLLARRTEIGHTHAEHGISFLLMTIGLVLKGVVLHRERLGIAMPIEDVARELETLAIGYLRINDVPRSPSKRQKRHGR